MADPSARRTTGTAMIEALEANGVRVVFGIPGTHNIELYRGLGRSDSIAHVLTKHEQGAAYAADGYARASGRAAVVITTSGPGLTNALTGMANAYADSIPMLVISPGIPTGQERSDIGWLHEMKDQRGAVDNVVERSVRVGTPLAAVDAIHEAFARWHVERPRPVHIEVPLDVLEQKWTHGAVADGYPAAFPAAPSPAAVEGVRRAVDASQRVVMIAGGGAVGAAADVTALAELLAAPVLTTTLGKGVIDERHALSVGEFATSEAVEPLLQDADLIIALGTEFAEPRVYRALTAPIIRVDIDTAQLQKNVRAAIPVHADTGEFARALLAALAPRAPRENDGRAVSARERALAASQPWTGRWRRIQDVLSAALPVDVIVTGDSSQVSYLGTGPYWRFAAPRHYIVTTGFSTLGYSLPAAIGAKIAHPEKGVVCLVGDGAFLFSAQEVLTAVEMRLPLPIIVVDNHGFAEIRQNMRDADLTPLAVDYSGLELSAFASAVGAHYVAAGSVDRLAAVVVEAWEADRPTIIGLDVGESG
jgi:acetolactate synthase-1/2/3 large subunit